MVVLLVLVITDGEASPVTSTEDTYPNDPIIRRRDDVCTILCFFIKPNKVDYCRERDEEEEREDDGNEELELGAWSLEQAKKREKSEKPHACITTNFQTVVRSVIGSFRDEGQTIVYR
jgi:hypothetical protein